MKGLLMKDLLNMKPQLRIYLLVIVAWFIIALSNGSYAMFSGCMMMFVLLIPMTVIAYDDKAGWENYALTMPVSRKDLVVSKYLFMLAITFGVSVISVIGGLFIGGKVKETMEFILVMIPIGLLMESILLPILFRFGVEKGRFVFLGVFLAFTAAGLWLKRQEVLENLISSYGTERVLLDNENFLPLLLWAAALVGLFLSIGIGCRIYQKKEF